MSWVNGDPASKIRTVVDLLPVVAAASGQAASRFVNTNDDAKVRRLTGIYSTYQTKNFRIHVKVAGKEIMVIDPAVFAAAAGFLPCDQMYGINQQLEYALDSPAGSAAAIVANTDQILFRYETTPDIAG